MSSVSMGLAIALVVGLVACSTQLPEQERFITDLDETQVPIFSTPNKINIIVLSDPIFIPGDNTVRENQLPTIEKIAELLNDFENTPILITGHTDNIGTFQQRYERSYAQAENLSKELVYKGVDPNRIKLTALGDKRPIAKNDTVIGRADNRRVEIVVYR